MKLHKNKFYIAILVLFSALFLNACGTNEVTEERAEVVFEFNDEEITLGEVYIYANTVIEDYERRYGDDVWNLDITLDNGRTVNMEEATREDIIESIVRVKVLYSRASQYDIVLTEAEEAEVTEKASDFYNKLTDAQLQEMQITQDVVIEVLMENAIAEKVYDSIIEEADIEVSFEEARQTTFYDMCFECYREGANGNIIEFTEEERDAQYERALQAYSTLVDPVNTENENNPESLSDYYGLKYSSYYTLSPEEIADMYGQEVCDEIYSLEDGSYSLVTETEYGYHIFYIKALTDSTATTSKKQEMEKELCSEYFDSLYNEWKENADKDFSYSDSVNQEVYERIEF